MNVITQAMYQATTDMKATLAAGIDKDYNLRLCKLVLRQFNETIENTHIPASARAVLSKTARSEFVANLQIFADETTFENMEILTEYVYASMRMILDAWIEYSKSTGPNAEYDAFTWNDYLDMYKSTTVKVFHLRSEV
jgi:hypothetical protein